MISMKGVLVAATVASLFASAEPIASAQQEPKPATVRCQGINSCKGKGACKSASNACQGQNGCKGQGFTYTQTEKECRDKGGTPLPPENKK